jgi:hypothetical protein
MEIHFAQNGYDRAQLHPSLFNIASYLAWRYERLVTTADRPGQTAREGCNGWLWKTYGDPSLNRPKLIR